MITKLAGIFNLITGEETKEDEQNFLSHIYITLFYIILILIAISL